MQSLTVNEIREKFLAFFEQKAHLRLKSFPLVPDGDKSLLLINSGMAPLKPYFTGQQIPPKPRIATCQKCVRTVDIDEVGKDARHVSFFEMLGNFSFDDYFKKEVIPWAWEFLTETMRIPADRLYISVYEEDQEAFDIWHKTIGIAPERIYKLGKADNFWEHGAGPCGPCSEIHFDRGEKYACDNPNCAVGCDCDRYMEVWNLVFTQFNALPDGGYEDLATTNIDTGMGLERLAIVMQEAESIFHIDTFKALRERVESLVSGFSGKKRDASINIIADHVRCVAFMAADGIMPSNDGRGYILRRLLRRGVRHGKLLGLDAPFIQELCKLVIAQNADAYPELKEKEAHILNVLKIEEEKFFATLDMGMALLNKQLAMLKERGEKTLSGEDAFKLYDTYGFPEDLTKEMLEEEGFCLDESGFKKEMEAQRNRARAARGESNYMGADETVFHSLDPAIFTKFVPSDAKVSGKVLAITAGSPQAVVTKAGKNDQVAIFLDATSFYVESGGQKGDRGLITTSAGVVQIIDCIKVGAGKTAHVGVVTDGQIFVGETAATQIDKQHRMATARNHTATHLLNKALREVLGGHVEQSGSEVSADRLRFDFTHFGAVTAEELAKIEAFVNEYALEGLPVTVKEMPLEEARKAGVVMLMGEKGDTYGDVVRVVSVGEISRELCGGTHIQNTAQIGCFKLLGENGIAAGIRRIEALTGAGAIDWYRENINRLTESASLLKTTPEKLTERIQALTGELKQAAKERDSLKAKMAEGSVGDLSAKVEEWNGFRLLAAKLDMDAAGLRTLADKHKDKVDILLLCGISGDSVQFMAAASPKAVDAGAHCGQIVKAAASVCGGGGGGRENSAQAGGKDISKADEALSAGVDLVKEQIK